MKKCPFCAEEIQDEAIKCRYCGELLKKKAWWRSCLFGCLGGCLFWIFLIFALSWLSSLLISFIMHRFLYPGNGYYNYFYYQPYTDSGASSFWRNLSEFLRNFWARIMEFFRQNLGQTKTV